MIILSVDTSAKTASTALCRDGTILAESFVNTGLTHSQTLVPMIDDMLKNAAVSINEVDLLTAVIGPGSFTGLRIGISAIKGMALASDKPCTGVSSLLAASYNLTLTDCIACCVMDARCEQVYNALFEVKDGSITRLCEDRAICLEDLREELKNIGQKIILTGDGTDISYDFFKDKTDNVFLPPPQLKYQRASGAALASFLLPGCEQVSGSSLMPVYLRLPQAERNLKAGLARI